LGGEANKVEGQKLMTEVPELHQRIADMSLTGRSVDLKSFVRSISVSVSIRTEESDSFTQRVESR
jgi:hypothetical protein